MHIILGLLGTIVTILVLLSRLADAGISLGGLNPFLWKRRRNWEKKYNTNPVFAIESPMEASALLLTAAAKIDGDMSKEQKQFLLTVFENDFHQTEKEAAGLLSASTYLLGDGQSVKNSLPEILKPSLPNFSQSQASSTVTLLNRLGQLDENRSIVRAEFIDKAESELLEPFKTQGPWA